MSIQYPYSVGKVHKIFRFETVFHDSASACTKLTLGLGFLFNHQWADMRYTGQSKQVAFQKRLQRWQGEYKGQLVLTHEEGLMLRDAAAVVNIPYDPGEPEDTPENVKKRTFVFADFEGMPVSTANAVDAVK